MENKEEKNKPSQFMRIAVPIGIVLAIYMLFYKKKPPKGFS